VELRAEASPVYDLELLDIWTVFNGVHNLTAADCLGNNYQMCLDDACATVEDGTLFSVASTTLSIKLDNSVDWSDFYITA